MRSHLWHGSCNTEKGQEQCRQCYRMGSIQRRKESQRNANKNIFVAVDDSEASDRAVTYVAQIVDGRRGFRILLFHVPASMPPQLLEFGGAEVPAQEERAEVVLSNTQAAWVEEVARAAQPIFARAKTRLSEAHIAEQDVQTLLFTPSAEQSLETSILTAARAHEC